MSIKDLPRSKERDENVYPPHERVLVASCGVIHMDQIVLQGDTEEIVEEHLETCHYNMVI